MHVEFTSWALEPRWRIKKNSIQNDLMQIECGDIYKLSEHIKNNLFSLHFYQTRATLLIKVY